MSSLYDPSLQPALTTNEIFLNRRRLPYIPTHSPKLNAVLGGGLRAEGTYVLTGGPGSGKTTQTLLLSDHVMQLGFPVIYISAELPPQLLLDRLACKYFQMSWLNVVDMDMDVPENYLKYQQFAQGLDQRLHVVGPESARLWRKHIIECRKRLDDLFGYRVPILIVVDYLQDLAQLTVSQGKEPRLAVSELSREMRFFAQEQYCPMLIVSSTGRQFYSGDEEVNDASLIASAKESGEIEYNVNAVLYVRRRELNKKPHTEIVVAKNRFGENPVSIVYATNPVTGECYETNWSGNEAMTASVIIAVYDLIKQNPGKFSKAGIVAKSLGMKTADVGAALDCLQIGSGPYKITYGDGAGNEGYFAMQEQPVEIEN